MPVQTVPGAFRGRSVGMIDVVHRELDVLGELRLVAAMIAVLLHDDDAIPELGMKVISELQEMVH